MKKVKNTFNPFANADPFKDSKYLNDNLYFLIPLPFFILFGIFNYIAENTYTIYALFYILAMIYINQFLVMIYKQYFELNFKHFKYFNRFFLLILAITYFYMWEGLSQNMKLCMNLTISAYLFFYIDDMRKQLGHKENIFKNNLFIIYYILSVFLSIATYNYISVLAICSNILLLGSNSMLHYKYYKLNSFFNKHNFDDIFHNDATESLQINQEYGLPNRKYSTIISFIGYNVIMDPVLKRQFNIYLKNVDSKSLASWYLKHSDGPEIGFTFLIDSMVEECILEKDPVFQMYKEDTKLKDALIQYLNITQNIQEHINLEF